MADAEQRITLVIPVKPLASGKSRLGTVLPDTRRSALTLMLLQRVLSCVRNARVPLEPWVVGGDPVLEALCRREGVECLEELGRDLNETVEQAFLRAFSQGAHTAIYLPADLPLLEAEDLEALVHASEGLHKLVLAPAERDGGTNAILVPGGLVFQLQLGDNSFLRHLELAQLNGWRCALCQRPGLAFDLDTPEDLELCGQRAPWFFGELERWEAFLESGAAIDAGPSG